jgi:hypothetical protein
MPGETKPRFFAVARKRRQRRHDNVGPSEPKPTFGIIRPLKRPRVGEPGRSG